MQIKLDQRKISRILIVCIMAILAVGMYVRSQYILPLWDDVWYQYVMSDEGVVPFFKTPGQNVKVESFDDIICSMEMHYFYVNGRLPIHFIVTIFASITHYTGFSLFMAFLMPTIILLFVRYTFPKGQWDNPLAYIASISIFFYLFIYLFRISFMNLAIGMNYLYPMALVLGWLLVQRDMSKGRNYSSWTLAGICVLSFFTGFSHEGYSLPLAGGLFLYSILNFKKISRQEWISYTFLWIGTAILFIAPANFKRIGALMDTINNFRILMVGGDVIAVKICLVLLILAWVKSKNKVKSVLKNEIIIVIILCLSIGFSIIANTWFWSMTPMQFYCVILTVMIICGLFPRDYNPTWKVNTFSLILITIFTIHQDMIIKTAAKAYHHTLEAMEEYAASDKGYMQTRALPISPIVQPWVEYWLDVYNTSTVDLICYTISVLNDTPDKKVILLGQKDAEALTNPEKFFTPSNKIPGNSEVFEGNKYFWIKHKDFKKDARYIVNHFKPSPMEAPYLLLALRLMVTPDVLPSTDTINVNTFIIDTSHDTIIGVPRPLHMWRRIESISVE